MRGEISKRIDGMDIEQKHFESVNMQMGRVQLDSDWNEAFATLLKGKSRSLADLVGRQGSPNEGFAIGDSLLLDHLDSQEGWSLAGPGSWNIDYFKEIEGKGCFRVCGEASLARSLPPVLKRFRILRDILVSRGATAGPARLAVSFRVSATDDKTQIRLLVESSSGTPTLATALETTYPCNGWQVLELDVTATDMAGYDRLSFDITTTGEVYLDRLVLYPGIVFDGAKDFYIQGGDGTSDGAGRYYLNGLACVKEGFETYLTQKDYPEPPSIHLTTELSRLAYLDVWRRTITGIEDDEILEVALNGPDTCTREQLVAQVKVLAGDGFAGCATNIEGVLRDREKTGALTAKLSPKSVQQKCDFRPELDYTGLDNSLYRIEIHQGGDKASATFKWSRNNGADLIAISEFLSDAHSVVVSDVRNLCCGDLVELCDDVSDLADFLDYAKHGVCAVIQSLDYVDNGVRITLDKSTVPFKGRTGRHPKLRKWHGFESVKDWLTFDSDGTPSKELEHGIRLAFSQDKFYHGDYWQIRARVNTRDIDELVATLPMGPEHHYAPLSVIAWSGKTTFKECRKLFPPLTALEAADILFDAKGCASMAAMGITNVQQALEFLCAYKGSGDEVVVPGMSIQDAIDRIPPEGGSVYLCPGVHFVTATIRINHRRNLTIRGDGAATCVVYLPGVGVNDDQDVRRLKEELNNLKADYAKEFVGKPLSDKVRDLKIAIREVTKKLAEAEKLRSLDLFRINASHDIAFSRFLMLAFDADSLVAALSSRVVSISDCDLFSIVGRGLKSGELNDDSWVKKKLKEMGTHESVAEEGRSYGATLLACIRVTDCCDLTVERCRLLGRAGIIQQGLAAGDMLPVVNGFCCHKNRFRVQTVALALLEGVHVTITENVIQAIAAGVSGVDWKLVEELKDSIFSLGNGCPLRITTEIYVLVDKLVEVFFSCLGEIGHERSSLSCGVLAFILRESTIEGNVICGKMGISNFYGDKNLLARNEIFSMGCAVSLLYSFSTTISENNLKTIARSASVPTPTPAPTPGPAPAIIAENGIIMSAPEISVRRDEATDGLFSARDHVRAEEYGDYAVRGEAFPLLECHFSDRLEVHANRFDGPVGMKAPTLSRRQFTEMLDVYGNFWPESLRDDADVLLFKRFTALLGLGPAIRLLETVLGFLAHGVEIDFIALLLADPADANDAAIYGELFKNPFVILLMTLCQNLIKMPLLSRALVTKNRFDVDRFGLLLEGIVPLGGTRFMENRIAGAADTAILWKALTLLTNPDLNGAILTVGYDLVVSALTMLRKFLASLLPTAASNAEGEETVSPIMVFAASMMLYGVGQVCPVAASGGETTTTTDPANPFEEPIKKIVADIDDLLDQLQSDRVKQTVSDLAAGDYLIFMNHIHGTGNGIHTNIANCTIQSNLINVEQGDAPVAALFSLGHRLASHTKVLNDVEKTGSGQMFEYAHGAVAALGLSLMNINPNALVTAGKTLMEKADQWNRLEEVFDGMGLTDVDEIDTGIEKLRLLVSQSTPATIEDLKQATSMLLGAIGRHLKGYGMILESPGVQVIANRVEALGFSLPGKSMAINKSFKEEVVVVKPVSKAEHLRPAPAGIMMTSSNDPLSTLMYLLLYLEETTPFSNLGGQGTRISDNSLQWGAGHGISLSAIPGIIDVRIEGNEIQNHGCAGVLVNPLLSWNLNINNNEINHCFIGKPTGPILFTMSVPNLLGGLMVSRALNVKCSGNALFACGAQNSGWPAHGAVFVNCINIDFTNNNVKGNGIKPKSLKETVFISAGGATFWGGGGCFVISDNRFEDNHGKTLLVGHLHNSYLTVQMNGNHLSLDDSPCHPTSIWVGGMSLNALVCTGNQIVIPNTVPDIQNSIIMQAVKLLFNSNQVLGGASLPEVYLESNQGLAFGNSLHRDLNTHGNITKDHNIF